MGTSMVMDKIRLFHHDDGTDAGAGNGDGDGWGSDDDCIIINNKNGEIK